jgi:hypothetical protein
LYSTLRVFTKYTPFSYNGNIYFKNKGVASGSYCTNAKDTFVNATLWYIADTLIKKYPLLAHKLDLGLVSFHSGEFDFSELLGTPLMERHDMCLCGDDALICTDTFEIRIHKLVCEYFGIDVTIKNIANSREESVYFLGKFWDDKGRPYQTERYMSAHIIFRTKFYKEGDLPDEVLRNLDISRVLSICLQFKNGLEYLEKSFKDWEPYVAFRQNREGFYRLSDWQFDTIEFVEYNKSLHFENF